VSDDSTASSGARRCAALKVFAEADPVNHAAVPVTVGYRGDLTFVDDDPIYDQATSEFLISNLPHP
jgi:hypothetical protein